MLGGIDICHQMCSQILQFCCLEEEFSVFSICERAELFAGAAHAVKILLSCKNELNFSQFPFTPLGNLVTVTPGETLERFCCPTEPFIKAQQSSK